MSSSWKVPKTFQLHIPVPLIPNHCPDNCIGSGSYSDSELPYPKKRASSKQELQAQVILRAACTVEKEDLEGGKVQWGKMKCQLQRVYVRAVNYCLHKGMKVFNCEHTQTHTLMHLMEMLIPDFILAKNSVPQKAVIIPALHIVNLVTVILPLPPHASMPHFLQSWGDCLGSHSAGSANAIHRPSNVSL